MTTIFPNAWHVARREYLHRVRSRTFVVMTAILAIVGLGFALLPVGLAAIADEEPRQLAVYAADADFPDPLAALEPLLNASAAPNGDVGFTLEATDDAQAATASVREGDLDGLLTIARAADGQLTFDYLTDASPLSSEIAAVRAATSQLTIGDRLDAAGLSGPEAEQIFAPTAFEVTAADPERTVSDEDFGGRYALAFVLVILTFMAIITYGNWVAASVAEEKSSRVMELLVTAATPRQLLFGKVLGTGAAGLTQYLVIALAAVIGLQLKDVLGTLLGVGASGAAFPTLTLAVLGLYGLFFLGGFTLYATLYAAVGSTVSRQEDLQQVLGPMIFLGMAGYFIFFVAVNDPAAGWVQIVSFIPFFSPYLMPMRLVFEAVAPWEIVGALVLLAVAVWVALMLAARIYSAGVLLYGQRLSLRNVLRAARVAR